MNGVDASVQTSLILPAGGLDSVSPRWGGPEADGLVSVLPCFSRTRSFFLSRPCLEALSSVKIQRTELEIVFVELSNSKINLASLA